MRSGGINVMTSGKGIAHAEKTPARNSGRLSGVQLWVALLDAHRNLPPSFTHVEKAPFVELGGGMIQVNRVNTKVAIVNTASVISGVFDIQLVDNSAKVTTP